MPKMKLTKTNIDKAPYVQKDENGKIRTVDYWDAGDGSLKGFGLRVGMTSKTFLVQVDVAGKTEKSTIGKYGLYTAEQAREEARERIRRLKKGEDAIPKDALTLQQMMDKHLVLNKFTKGTEDAYRNQLPVKFAGWMDMTITEMSSLEPDIVVERFQQILKDNGPMAAKNTFEKLQSIMNHARVLYPKHVARNPFAVLSEGKYWPKTKARTDKLKGNEFKQYYDRLQAFNEVTRDAFIFALYQGMRNVEAASLRWEYVDLEEEALHLPDTKNDEPLHIPLSRQSVAILKRRQAANVTASPFVFPTQKPHLSKTGHIVLKAEALKLRTGLALSVHGLRRTFTDIADNKIKVKRQDVDRMINHKDGSVTGKHYSHHDLEDLREGLQKTCNEIERLMIEGVGAKIITLPTAQGE